MEKISIAVLIALVLTSSCHTQQPLADQPDSADGIIYFSSGFLGHWIRVFINKRLVLSAHLTTDQTSSWAATLPLADLPDAFDLELRAELPNGPFVSTAKVIKLQDGKHITVYFTADERQPFVIDQEKTAPEFP